MTHSRIVLRVTLTYVVVAALWIFFSDILLFRYASAFFDTTLGSILKGLAFILVTACLLYVLVLRLVTTQEELYRAEMTSELDFFGNTEFFSALPVIVYVLEAEGGTVRPVWISDNLQRLFGYPLSDGLDPAWWPAQIHPEDRDRVLAKSGQLLESGGGEHAYRFRKADGDYVFINDELHALPNGGRTPQRYLGVWTDIDYRYKAEKQMMHQARQLEASVANTVNSIARMVELRDPYTAGHEERVGELAAAIASEMGFDETCQRGLRVAGMLHDLGKIGVPVEILIKPSRLLPGEFALVKEHAAYGFDILKDIDFPWPIAEVAHQHHERINGSGYPRGLSGTEILMEARIVAVADVVESMASHRPYRPSLGVEVALQEIERGAGELYDADVVRACLLLFREKGYQLSV